MAHADEHGTVVELHGHPVRVVGWDAAALAAGMAVNAVAFNDLVGLRFTLVSPDRIEAELPIVEDHLQPSGVVHGGVYCTLVEAVGSTGSVAHVTADGKVAMGVHNATSFVRPTEVGDRLTAVATPVHLGRSQHLWDVEVVRGDGRLAAQGQLRTAIVAPRSGR